MKMTATFCGHAQISRSADVEKWLYAVTLHLIEQGVNIFYLGGYGAFDSLAAAVCEFQSNGAPVPEERCAHSNANGVAVPFQTA